MRDAFLVQPFFLDKHSEMSGDLRGLQFRSADRLCNLQSEAFTMKYVPFFVPVILALGIIAVTIYRPPTPGHPAKRTTASVDCGGAQPECQG
jgi:hypothetical protein